MNPILKRSSELAMALYDYNFNLRCQHFSFIFYKGKLLAVGKNSVKTNPWNLLNPKHSITGENISGIKGTCSELSACLKVKRTNIPFNKCILVNIRIDKSKHLCYARPCQSCQSLLKYLSFKTVYYSISDELFNKYE